MYMTRDLWQLVKKNTAKISIMTFWTTIPVILDVLQMICYSFLLLTIINRRGVSEIATSVVLVLLSMLAQRGSEHILILKKAKCGNNFKSEFRAELFEKLFQLGPAFIDRKQTGEIINTLWERIEWVFFYLFYYIPTSVMVLILSVACACIWMPAQPIIFCAFLSGGILVIISPPLFHRFAKNRGKDEWDENDAFYSTCLDGLQGIVTLKSFNANARHRAKVEEMAEANRRSTMANLVFTTLNGRLIELVVSLSEILIVVIGVLSMSNGTITPSQLIGLFLIVQAWSAGAKRILGAWLRGSKGAAAYESSLEILKEQYPYSLTDLKNEGAMPADMDEDGNDLELSDVSFSYSENSAPVLDNINFKVEAGTQTALVGSSGSGKSTITHLLFGFYKPQLGEVKIGKRPLTAENVKSLQQKMTVIWQNCHIFHMSCFDNIRIAKQNATEEEVYSAAKKANIHDMILQLPDGYSTIIGDGGRTFSGGEKQRIAIARAFLRNTPILILDEATSSVDTRTEVLIQKSMRELIKGRTSFVIAHRLSTVTDADVILVVSDGRLVEKGTHEELLEKHGFYYDIFMSQFEG